jgi:hypothetical protein
MGLAVTMTPSGSSALVQCTSGAVGIPPKLLGIFNTVSTLPWEEATVYHMCNIVSTSFMLIRL